MIEYLLVKHSYWFYIAMIMVGEVLAGWVRGVFLERGKVDAE